MIKNYLTTAKRRHESSHGGTAAVDLYEIWGSSDFKSDVDFIDPVVVPPGFGEMTWGVMICEEIWRQELPRLRKGIRKPASYILEFLKEPRVSKLWEYFTNWFEETWNLNRNYICWGNMDFRAPWWAYRIRFSVLVSIYGIYYFWVHVISKNRKWK